MKTFKYISLALVLMLTIFAIPTLAEGEGGIGDAGNKFVETLFDDVIKNVIALVGAGFLLSGAMQIIEGTQQENAAAKTQGWKALAGGAGLLILAFVGVPALRDYALSLIGGKSSTGALIINSNIQKAMTNVLSPLF